MQFIQKAFFLLIFLIIERYIWIIMTSSYMYYLLYARHMSMCFTYIVVFNSRTKSLIITNDQTEAQNWLSSLPSDKAKEKQNRDSNTKSMPPRPAHFITLHCFFLHVCAVPKRNKRNLNEQIHSH